MVGLSTLPTYSSRHYLQAGMRLVKTNYKYYVFKLICAGNFKSNFQFHEIYTALSRSELDQSVVEVTRTSGQLRQT